MNHDDEIERLELALALHFARLVLDADEVIDSAELAFVERVFPTDRLVATGLIDARGALTPEFETARIRAVLELPAMLSLPRRLDLLATVYRAAVSDGDLDRREFSTLQACAGKLGVEPDLLSAHLDALSGVVAPAPRKRP
jgi:uncharacterized tellurite resistance protein B-like protein